MFRIDLRTMLMMAAFSFASFAFGIGYVAIHYAGETPPAESAASETNAAPEAPKAEPAKPQPS